MSAVVKKHVIAGASFTAPINYRPNNGSAFVRTQAYDEADTVDYRVCQAYTLIARCASPLLETARASTDPTRSVVSVEVFE